MKSTNEFTDNKGQIFGIDLGTSNSVISVIRKDKYGNINSIPIVDAVTNTAIIPSFVELNKDNTFNVGRDAYLNRDRDNVAYSFKRNMGTHKRATLVNGNLTRKMTSVELSTQVLLKLKEIAEKSFGEGVVEDVVITVPAYFNDKQRTQTILAGEAAGLNVISLISEPTAAIYNYIHTMGDKLDEDDLIVVYDLGGGTFDVSKAFIDLGDGERNLSINIEKTAGDNKLGGDDIDEYIYDIIILRAQSEFLKELGIPKLKSMITNHEKELILKEIEKIKIKDLKGATITLKKNIDGVDYDIKIKINEDDIRMAYANIYNETKEKLDNLQTRNFEATKICLVGGATKSRFLIEFLERDYPGVVIYRDSDPDLAVSQGAARHHYNIVGDKKLLTLYDVISLPIGIEVDGYNFERIISKDEALPAKKYKDFTPNAPNQKEMRLKIFQGEGKLTEDNIYLGDLIIDNLPQSYDLDTYVCRVQLSCDLNGILSIKAKTRDNMVEKQLQLSTISKQDVGSKISKEMKYANILLSRGYKSLLENESVRGPLEALKKDPTNKDLQEALKLSIKG